MSLVQSPIRRSGPLYDSGSNVSLQSLLSIPTCLYTFDYIPKTFSILFLCIHLFNQPSNMRLQVARAPPGTIACVFDIQVFHRTCPVSPDHKPWLVVCINNICWINHDNPFGTRSASSNSGQSGNAIVDIWDAEDTDVTFKYEDDMSQFQFPSAYGPFIDGLYHYRHDRDSSMALIAPLNVPWHPTKTGDRFVSIFIFIGFLWDLILKQVTLPVHKRIKFLYRVDNFPSKANSHTKVSLLEVQQIHGSLVHICFVYLDGSSRLPVISNFMSSFKANEFSRRYIPKFVSNLYINNLRLMLIVLSFCR